MIWGLRTAHSATAQPPIESYFNVLLARVLPNAGMVVPAASGKHAAPRSGADANNRILVSKLVQVVGRYVKSTTGKVASYETVKRWSLIPHLFQDTPTSNFVPKYHRTVFRARDNPSASCQKGTGAGRRRAPRYQLESRTKDREVERRQQNSGYYLSGENPTESTKSV